MAEEEVVLKYHDVAVFRNQELDGPQKEIADRKMISYLHSFLNNQAEKGGTRFLPNEIVKTPEDVKIVEAVIRMVTEQMISLKREKIMDIPLPFIHLVPEGANCESNPVFGGIVVERTADHTIFAVKLFQKVFCRMSYSAVKVCDQRQLVCIDVGNSFKEAVASLKSREFLERAIQGGLLKKAPIIEEKLFDLKAEMVFMRELNDLWERNKRLFPKERFFQNMVEATINGRIVPMMVLRDRRVDLGEAKNILSWINGAGTRMF